MLLDDVALYSVTPSWQANKQSRLLLDYVGADSVVRARRWRVVHGWPPCEFATLAPPPSTYASRCGGRDGQVTDCCACVGGNVISFAKYFKFVNAVEYSRQRARLLQHNVNAAGVGAKVSRCR